ncbi:hypothetical protein ACLB2K_073849 [Fragaria x ananassa]
MRSSIWKRPPPGWFSVCLDGAFDPNKMSGGVGIVVRDWHACRFVLDHGLSPVKFETESVQLVQAVSSPSWSSDHLQLGQSYEDVADLFMQLPGCSFTRIFREGNEAAQKVALWALASQPCNVYFSSTPPILEEVISAHQL